MIKTDSGVRLDASGTTLELSRDEKKPNTIHVIKDYSSKVHEKELMIGLRWFLMNSPPFPLDY